MRAIEYVSYADASGYGQAAVGYVRLLMQAGFAVHWKPWLNDALWAGRVGPEFEQAELARGRASLLARAASGQGNAIESLIAATAMPLDARIRILHLMPAFWPQHISPMPSVRHIGMTVWETDRITPHWLPQLARMDHLCVPCEHNAAVLRAARPKLPPVSVVPHVCRGELHPPPAARLASLAKWLKIRPNDTVFYTINAWDPRKRLAELVEGFVRNFRAEDPVALVVKSGRRALFDDPATPGVGRGVAEMFAHLVGRVAAELGREPPRISLLADDDLADNVIDGLHALGHCYVSLSRAEGFGLGGFDAATQGRPVIAVGYGGPLDYLGQDWPGRVPHRMVKCEALPGFTWFDPEQNWPEPDDAAAFDLMRQFVADRSPFMAHAAAAAARIRSHFDAATIARQLREMIDNVG